jgi:polysaccharide biosynthesis/export protein
MLSLTLSFIFAIATAFAEQPANPGAARAAASPERAPQYLLGPGDQVQVSALELEEISKTPYRIDDAGYVTIPLAGRIKASGLTVTQLESQIRAGLLKYQIRPEVSVGVMEYRSQPISIIGAVTNPGVHHLQGAKTLIEALSLAGGLRTDAGNAVKITRQAGYGPIPLPSATQDAASGCSVAEVKVQSILNATNPAENITVRPNDVISVPRAEMVYVMGQVEKTGGFVLTERESMSVLQAISLAGGLNRMAAARNARILRFTSAAQQRREEAVDLKKIMDGKAPELFLNPDDILFVPGNNGKIVALRTIEAAVSAGTGIAVWRSSR